MVYFTCIKINLPFSKWLKLLIIKAKIEAAKPAKHKLATAYEL